ncbi:hypothetical protein [Kitasatospora paranensis]|uniref:DUF2771 domain-containing protein n=1 Tax=Kitasatospora paranensis TaxID=258053 RepID=A0ABW2FNZ0_9ACTN
MSLSTRAFAALGALVVIGAGTVGGSIAYANSEGAPPNPKQQATLTVGTSSVRAQPLCYNGGKALAQDVLAKCQADAKTASQKGTLAHLDVISSDRVGVGVSTEIADKGWFAFTDGGSQGQTPLAQDTRKATWSGSVLASSVLNSSGTTTVTVVEADQAKQEILGIWYFQMNSKGQ